MYVSVDCNIPKAEFLLPWSSFATVLVSFSIESRNLLVNRQEVIWHQPQLYSRGYQRHLVPFSKKRFHSNFVKLCEVLLVAAVLC